MKYISAKSIDRVYKFPSEIQKKICEENDLVRRKERIDGYLVYCYTEDEFIELMQLAGFQVVESYEQKQLGWTRKFYPRLP